MDITMLWSKIHGAIVTDANLEYEGSIGIDRYLMDQANLLPAQKVSIYNITNGNRLDTYVIELPAHSGRIEINGAAAHLTQTGDKVIIASYANMNQAEAQNWQPAIVMTDENNRPKQPAKAA